MVTYNGYSFRAMPLPTAPGFRFFLWGGLCHPVLDSAPPFCGPVESPLPQRHTSLSFFILASLNDFVSLLE